jgi:hypothetical protein
LIHSWSWGLIPLQVPRPFLPEELRQLGGLNWDPLFSSDHSQQPPLPSDLQGSGKSFQPSGTICIFPSVHLTRQTTCTGTPGCWRIQTMCFQPNGHNEPALRNLQSFTECRKNSECRVFPLAN